MNAKPAPERLPPHDDGAEAGALGCVLLAPALLPDLIRQTPCPEVFYVLQNRVVFEALAAMHREGILADPLTLHSRLTDSGKLDDAGGIAYVSALPDRIPNEHHFPQYLKIVRERYVARKAIQTAAEITDAAWTGNGNIGAIIAAAASAFDYCRGLCPTATAIESRPLFSITRPPDNDPAELLRHKYLCRGGGLLLAAPTGIGKSSFAIQAAIAWRLGREHFGIHPARPLRTLIVQGENDDQDITQMRDGIAAGLELSEHDRASLQDGLWIYYESGKTGAAFLAEVVRPLLEKHRPDILVIDPVFSYLGASASDQERVSLWLRALLNPLLRAFDCGVILVHHTNKPPSGKEKPSWQAGDFAYLGAGSAEWANWSRAVLSIASVGSHSVFRLHAAKRGARLHWRNGDGETSFERMIAHAREPDRIYWRDADPDEITTGGRPKSFDVGELLDLVTPDGLTTSHWQTEAKTECGIGERRFYQLLGDLKKSNKIFKSKVSGRWTKNR